MDLPHSIPCLLPCKINTILNLFLSFLSFDCVYVNMGVNSYKVSFNFKNHVKTCIHFFIFSVSYIAVIRFIHINTYKHMIHIDRYNYVATDNSFWVMNNTPLCDLNKLFFSYQYVRIIYTSLTFIVGNMYH